MKKMTKIYLACPYSSNTAQEEERFTYSCVAAATLINCSCIVFSPICHSHPIARIGGLIGSWKIWKEQDFPFIEWCDIIIVLKLLGWEYSYGVAEEVEYAAQLNKPILFIKMEELCQSAELMDRIQAKL